MATSGVLTGAEKEHFLAHGWIKIPGAFTKEQAEEKTKNVWNRLEMCPTDPGTWTKDRVHMPDTFLFDAADFAPRAWAAICELCGGEERIDPECRSWRDTFIVNLGSPEKEGVQVPPQQLDNWHVDGDFFVHYLDSPEQGLLVIPLFTDIVPGGGATALCPPGMAEVARWLYGHPEGVSPRMVPRGEPDFDKERNLDWFNSLVATRDSADFVEATGSCGDVFLLHPLMLHSATTNPLRRVRIITNPPVSMREPFRFSRPDKDYSLVELATLRALGKEDLGGWEITAPRQAVIPERVRIWERMKAEQARKLEEVKTTKEVKNEVSVAA